MRIRPVNRRRWANILITIGVAAWIPHGVLKYGLGQEIPVYPFLAWHLAGILPGFLLRRGDLSGEGCTGGGGSVFSRRTFLQQDRLGCFPEPFMPSQAVPFPTV